jgi:hypothetical protein
MGLMVAAIEQSLGPALYAEIVRPSQWGRYNPQEVAESLKETQ